MFTPLQTTDAVQLEGRRILFISEATKFGGHESMALRAAAGLSRAGASVAFRFWAGNQRLRQAIAIANDSGASIALDEGAANDVRLGSLRWWTRRHEAAAAQRMLASDTSFARVLVQGRIDSGLVTLHAARSLGVQLVSYLPMAHTLRQMGVTILPGMREWVLKRHYASLICCVAIDEAVAKDLRLRGVQGPIEVVENWIPSPEIASAAPETTKIEARAELALPVAPPIVATIGRIDFAQKGHPHLLRALASPAGRALGAHWLIVGDGPDLPALRDQVHAAGLADWCHFRAWIDGDMECVYQAIDVVALPSNFEGVPLVMLEALTRRIPVVGSDIDGLASWLPVAARFDRTNASSVVRSLKYSLETLRRCEYEDAFTRARRATVYSHFVNAWASALTRLVDSNGS